MSKIPIACTLSADAQMDRVDEWRRIKSKAVSAELTDVGACLTFALDAAIARDVAELMAREIECCAFFTFSLTATADQLVLTIAAPEDATEIVAAFVA